jgi:hypothetical protein
MMATILAVATCFGSAALAAPYTKADARRELKATLKANPEFNRILKSSRSYWVRTGINAAWSSVAGVGAGLGSSAILMQRLLPFGVVTGMLGSGLAFGVLLGTAIYASKLKGIRTNAVQTAVDHGVVSQTTQSRWQQAGLISKPAAAE